MKRKLYLVPNLLNPEAEFNLIPLYIGQAIKHVRLFFVEEEKSAQRLLKKIDPQFPVAECEFLPLNEHTPSKQCEEYIKRFEGQDAAIISEVGCPCVADPGADVVSLAHKKNIEVIPLVGPSSILLALMASGLNGQNFAFNGYLPKEKGERTRKIRELEKRSFVENQTQIFMETPYRNQALFEDILAICEPRTHLCLAYDITSPGQFIKTLTVREWKEESTVLHKKPALFLIEKKVRG